ncbi:hypothetical protein TWF481_009146 [Arthrobotrys musiformis]|uniref:Uncharacterized protein n=1 Tax=Arthrobotrys musiformis TaxID=47236 RepID=A0AAV9W4M0_9PEZI
MRREQVENILRALSNNLDLTILLARRRETLAAHGASPGGPARQSVFTERFDLVSDDDDDNKLEEETRETNDAVEVLSIDTAGDAATSPTSQPRPQHQPQHQHQPRPLSTIIEEEDEEGQNIISGSFTANTAWLKENIPDLVPPGSFLPHKITKSESDSEENTTMGKQKTAKQAHRKAAKTAAKATRQQSPPPPNDSKEADITQIPGPDTESNTDPGVPADPEAIQTLLQTVSLGGASSGPNVPEIIALGAAGPSSDTEPVAEQLVVDEQLLRAITDLGVFTKWRRDQFLDLSRNDLLVFIHIYRRDKMPKPSDKLGEVKRIFFDHVYGKYYWISWVRDIILRYLKSPAAEMVDEDTIITLKAGADDLGFLEALAPEFKALCQERFAQYNARLLEASQGEEREDTGGPTIDITVGGAATKKNKKKKKKGKGKGKERSATEEEEVGGDGEEEGASVSMGLPQTLEAAPRAPQVLQSGDVSDLVDLFTIVLLQFRG